MRYEQEIKRLLSELHKPWMDDADKAEFDRTMSQRFGRQLADDIETGVRNGHTVEQQIELARAALWRAVRSS